MVQIVLVPINCIMCLGNITSACRLHVCMYCQMKSEQSKLIYNVYHRCKMIEFKGYTVNLIDYSLVRVKFFFF